ncbi:MAG: FAD-dependent oxidoreductase [Ferruginibacter sp.]
MAYKILDVAIIGAGVSGLYSAWRILSDGYAKEVTVFEASEHIGGRLLSVVPPNIPDMVAELGGMRILPAVQPRIAKLIDSLNSKIKMEDKIETFPFPVDQNENISYLRGTHLRLQDFADHSPKIPFSLTFQERGKIPGQIILNAIEQIVPGITDSKLSEAERRIMARSISFNGKPLYQQGFWQVLAKVISAEAYQLALSSGGYETTLINWNAADAIPWYLSDFGVAPDYRGFRNGFQQVPLLLSKLVHELGGKVVCNHSLLGFNQTDDLIELTIQGQEPIKTKALILAMPRRSLELISPNSPILQQENVLKLIRSVTPRPLFKLYTTYSNPWWRAAGVQKGRTTTDLPIRQTYYWPKNTGEPAEIGTKSMLMASYDDGLNIGFWDGFRPKRADFLRSDIKVPTTLEWFEGPANQNGGEYKLWDKYKAPAAMVEEIQRQLALIHGLQFTPGVQDACFKDWGDDPFGGGWNSWNIGVDSDKVKVDILKPETNAPVYVCGEAYSDAQGWVEGALQTADMMLEKHFKISAL